MQTTARWLTGVCVLLVALPTAPCALISQGCPFEAGGLLEGGDAAPPSCCAKHLAATATAPTANSVSIEAKSPSKPAAPCTRDCCKVRSLPPLAEKVAGDQAVMPLLVATVEAAIVPAMPSVSLDRQLNLLGPPLQILHCQWRL